MSVNFPTIYTALMKNIRKVLRESTNPKVSNHRIIDGYYFEDAVLEGLEELVVMYANKQKEVKGEVAMFRIAVRIEEPGGTPLRELKKGCLYHLRSHHPVIDYAALLTDAVDTNKQQHWLLLVQVSLSPYKEHKSKAGDLWNKVSGPEARENKEAKTWLQYYQELARKSLQPPSGDNPPPTFRTMYIYISPNEVAGQGDNPCDALNEPDVRSPTKDLYLGLIYKNSETYELIIKLSST